eukprot:TRINITY_DN37980_c0_g1_i1.p1 TRINITY_DN37980_c0_g1~~TRINITY_DN37980_c0_g1_i1.p1  ORF type:complete len:364 (+),score=98.41 TRINITY_DN37980_c0_g1_i1:28-1092(+)
MSSTATPEEVLVEAGRFENLLNTLDDELDKRILEANGDAGKSAKEQAMQILKEFKRTREKAADLESAILTCKDETRSAIETMKTTRDNVKGSQAELSCIMLETHALELERNQTLLDVTPAIPERKLRDEAEATLLKLKRKNKKYPETLAKLNSETVRLEEEILQLIEKDKLHINMLKERCIKSGQALYVRQAVEQEYAELRLVVAEQEEEIKALQLSIKEKNSNVPSAPRLEREKYFAELSKPKKSAKIVTKYFALPTGALRGAVTVQGYGFQALRAKYSVQIESEQGDFWGSHIITITGLDPDVASASKDLQALCQSTHSKEKIITYTRTRPRAAPIPTPWAKMQRQRAEIEM